MINIPIWLFILFCVFGFVGLLTTLVLMYCFIGCMFTKDFEYVEEEDNGKQED